MPAWTHRSRSLVCVCVHKLLDDETAAANDQESRSKITTTTAAMAMKKWEGKRSEFTYMHKRDAHSSARSRISSTFTLFYNFPFCLPFFFIYGLGSKLITICGETVQKVAIRKRRRRCTSGDSSMSAVAAEKRKRLFICDRTGGKQFTSFHHAVRVVLRFVQPRHCDCAEIKVQPIDVCLPGERWCGRDYNLFRCIGGPS